MSWYTAVPPMQPGSNLEVRYNAKSLVEYMLSTGDTTEPTTRLAFTDEQLSALDTLVKKYTHAFMWRASAQQCCPVRVTLSLGHVCENGNATQNIHTPQALKAKLGLGSVLEAKTRGEYYAQQKLHRDLIEGVRVCVRVCWWVERGRRRSTSRDGHHMNSLARRMACPVRYV